MNDDVEWSVMKFQVADRAIMLFAIIAVLYLGTLIGHGLGLDEARNAAIKAGVGRWVVDEDTKARTFVWISPKGEEK